MTDGTQHRPTLSHEQLFLFAKGPHHFFDKFAIHEESSTPGSRGGGSKRRFLDRGSKSSVHTDANLKNTITGQYRGARSVWTVGVARVNGRAILADHKVDGRYLYRDPECPSHGDNPEVPAGPLFGAETEALLCTCKEVTEDFYAAMPEALAEKCIASGSSAHGCCPDCGAPYRRVLEKTRVPTRPGTGASLDPQGKSHRDPLRHVTESVTAGWEPTCDHGFQDVVPSVVFDPFAGSGTTPRVAEALGRAWLATELNPSSAKLARARLGRERERTTE